MKFLPILAKRAARGLMVHAAWVAPTERADWARAMINEFDCLPADLPTFGWALGCLFVGYSERIRAMIRSLESPPRWMLVLEALICFVPLTLLFANEISMALHGGFGLPEGLIYCSGSILGPLGLAATVVLLQSRKMRGATIAGLCVLAVWTLTVYSAQILTFGQSHLADWWREFVFVAVLPSLSVFHLAFVNSYSRASLVAAT